MHDHKGQMGPPYDASKLITCPACIAEIKAYRADLCEKYGWDEWPDALKGGIDESL